MAFEIGHLSSCNKIININSLLQLRIGSHIIYIYIERYISEVEVKIIEGLPQAIRIGISCPKMHFNNKQTIEGRKNVQLLLFIRTLEMSLTQKESTSFLKDERPCFMNNTLKQGLSTMCNSVSSLRKLVFSSCVIIMCFVCDSPTLPLI